MPEDEQARAARMLFALHTMVAAGPIAGRACLFDFRALAEETILAALDSEMAAQDEEEGLRMSDILPEPGATSMPDPVQFVCSGCGATFTCDRTSEAARSDPKLCPDCMFPEVRGL